MKQINLFTPFWKEVTKYVIGFIIGCFLCFWLRGCSSDNPVTQIAKVEVPEAKGVFEAEKPVHEPILIKANSPKLKVSTEPNALVQKLIDENLRLVHDFAKASDSIKQLSFNKAIQLNKFSTKFEDDNLLLNIDGVVQGEVKEVTPSYTIKKKTVEVPIKQKETVFRVLTGGAVGLNKELNQVAYQLDLNFQNRKGDIISAEYLNVGGQNFGMVGFKKSILNIKR